MSSQADNNNKKNFNDDASKSLLKEQEEYKRLDTDMKKQLRLPDPSYHESFSWFSHLVKTSVQLHSEKEKEKELTKEKNIMDSSIGKKRKNDFLVDMEKPDKVVKAMKPVNQAAADVAKEILEVNAKREALKKELRELDQRSQDKKRDLEKTMEQLLLVTPDEFVLFKIVGDDTVYATLEEGKISPIDLRSKIKHSGLNLDNPCNGFYTYPRFEYIQNVDKFYDSIEWLSQEKLLAKLNEFVADKKKKEKLIK